MKELGSEKAPRVFKAGRFWNSNVFGAVLAGGVGGGSAIGYCPAWSYNTSTNQLNTSQGFAYDAAGDLTTDVSGLYKRYYAWDAEGRLTQVTDSGGNTTTSYVYNALGQEVELKTVGGWQLEQVFDPQGQRVGYYSPGNSQWLLAYVPWRGRELAKYAWSTYFNFFHPNPLGSAAISTDQTGTVDDDILFYPWGQIWLNAGSNTYDTHFAGIHAGLQGSNLMDFSMYEAPYRFYAPNPGRWHSPDPLAGDITNPQSLNRYAYALNNPTSFVDPSGAEYCLLVTDSEGNESIDETSCVSDTDYGEAPSQYPGYVQVSQDVTVFVTSSTTSDSSSDSSVTVPSILLTPYALEWEVQQAPSPVTESIQAPPQPPQQPPSPAWQRGVIYTNCVMNPEAFGAAPDESANGFIQGPLYSPTVRSAKDLTVPVSPGPPAALNPLAGLAANVPGCVKAARGQ
jgi:RHS repeat-associated protein